MKTGELRFYLAGNGIPNKNVESVFIKVEDVFFEANNFPTPASGFIKEGLYNLAYLQDSSRQFLGEIKLPSGIYSKVQIKLSTNEENNTGIERSYIVLKNGAIEPLYLAENLNSMISIDTRLSVPYNNALDLLAVLDLRKSIYFDDVKKHWILDPVFSLSNMDLSGAISGNFINKSKYNEFDLFLYEQGKYVLEDSANVLNRANFSHALKHAEIENKNFKFTYIEAGVYEIAVAAYENGILKEVLGFYKDIQIQKNTINEIDLNTNKLSKTP